MYLQDIRATGHRDSYDSRPPRSRPVVLRPFRCFCSALLVALLSSASAVAVLRRPRPSPPRNGGRGSFRRVHPLVQLVFFFFFFFSPSSPFVFFPLEHRRWTRYQAKRPGLLPLFPSCARVLLFPFLPDHPLLLPLAMQLFLPPSSSLSLSPGSSLPSLLTQPRPRTLGPVVTFFWSLFPGIVLIFLPARRQVSGLPENGQNGRTAGHGGTGGR